MNPVNFSSSQSFNVACLSLVRDMEKPFLDFAKIVVKELVHLPERTYLVVLPEYCWRLTPWEDLQPFLRWIQWKIPDEMTVVLGTKEFPLSKTINKVTNNAIVLTKQCIYYSPKNRILDDEVRQGLFPGQNVGVIPLPRFNLAIAVCADLWNHTLLHNLVFNGKADIIAVPAWTATTGTRERVKQLWHSLALTRSAELGVVVAVSDHHKDFARTKVGCTTIITDPSQQDREFPEKEFVSRVITPVNIDEVRKSRQRWIKKGLIDPDEIESASSEQMMDRAC